MAPFLSIDDAPAAKDDFLHGGIVGEHGNDSSALAGACRAVRDFCTRAPQLFGTAAGAVEHGDAKAGFEKIAGHGLSHSTKPNKANTHQDLLQVYELPADGPPRLDSARRSRAVIRPPGLL
jgi:hypothetical protein